MCCLGLPLLPSPSPQPQDPFSASLLLLLPPSPLLPLCFSSVPPAPPSASRKCWVRGLCDMRLDDNRKCQRSCVIAVCSHRSLQSHLGFPDIYTCIYCMYICVGILYSECMCIACGHGAGAEPAAARGARLVQKRPAVGTLSTPLRVCERKRESPRERAIV